MTIDIDPAGPEDLDTVTDLLLDGARARSESGPLWPLVADPSGAIRTAVGKAMTDPAPPFRQRWLIARRGGVAIGVTHSILLPVPPIYAGAFGPPGLIMEGSHIREDAPERTGRALLAAAEGDLRDAGARLLLASSRAGGRWESGIAEMCYKPLTTYYAKSELTKDPHGDAVRPAREEDVPGIVLRSAAHRRILNDLETFWQPHPEADARFGAWMTRSLTLTDRDMFVTGPAEAIRGYAVSQPATPLHFPAPHDVTGIGVIDDFHHEATADPAHLAADTTEALALLAAAEAARALRGDRSVIVVCPADWQSKRDLLTRAGYANAITWYLRRPSE